MNNLTQIRTKTDQIAEALAQHIKHEGEPMQNLGIFSGAFGIWAFLAYYRKYTGSNRAVDEIYDPFTQRCFDELCERPAYYSHCTGVAGILSLLRIMDRSGVYEIDYSELTEAYRPYLLQIMNDLFGRDDWDYLHGAMGIALCFADDPAFASAAVGHLERLAIHENGTIKWKSLLNMGSEWGFNISLSHGMSSILLILSRIHKNGLETARIERLAAGTVGYILAQRVDHTQYGNYFPSASIESSKGSMASRMAWCYGDPGVALALFDSAAMLRDDALRETALEVLRHAAMRRNPATALIYDAQVCHGSAGLALVFNAIHRRTGEALFAETRDYWLAMALQMGTHPGNGAGYKNFHTQEQKWVVEYPLLEGISGIGLVFLSTLSGDFAWDDLFLL